VLAPNV